MIDPGQVFRKIDDSIRKQADSLMPDWESCSLVYETGEGESLGNFGYVFGANTRKPFALDDDELDAMVLSLRQMMPLGPGMQWRQALLQIPRSGKGMAMQFEFENPGKWSVRPSSAESDIQALRIATDISALVPQGSPSSLES